MAHRRFTLACDSKGDEQELEGVVSRTADIMTDPRVERVVLRPKYEEQRREFRKALATVYRQGSWTPYIDELYIMGSPRQLGLQHDIDKLFTQGRSKGISVVFGCQRPVFIPAFAISSCTHVLAFRQQKRDIKRIEEATGDDVVDAIRGVRGFDFVWYYRKTHQLWTGSLQDLAAGEMRTA